MKSDTLEDTPSKKKMKQACLPFKIISETATAPITNSTSSRKRKLSSDNYKESKIGKLTKENETSAKISDDLIVIIDDDSCDKTSSEKVKNDLLTEPVSSNSSTDKRSTRSSNKSDDKEKGTINKVTPKTNKSVPVGKPDKDKVSVNNLSPKSSRTSCVTEDSDKDKKNVNILTPRRAKNVKNNGEIKLTPKSTRTSVSDSNDKNNETHSTPKSIKKPTQIVDKEPTTPKSSGNTSLSENSDSATKLTPKQLQKKLEAAKRREEREKEKEERDKKKQEEKEERMKLKQDKEDQKKKEREEKEEIKKKEREEKEELRKKEKEEKDKQRELEKKLKEEKEEQKRKEREEKEDQRRKEKEAKEEEKRKKQEQLELEKQEQELKKKKAAEAFANFFVLKQKVDKESSIGPISKSSVLSSFTVKADMRLAPTVRGQFTEEKKKNLDEVLENQNLNELLYVKCLKDGLTRPGRDGKTWPSDKDDDDVIVVEDELQSIEGMEEILSSESVLREKLRPKLLSFKENKRPPYWGTWRKKSLFIKPRNPFGKDEKLLDYEVDSDEEWEDEEGESIDGSRCSDDDMGELDEYEVDNEVFVPHGYLSDEEGTMDGDDMLSLSPETQKARLKHLEDEFETEMKKPTEKLKPRLFGPLWVTENGGKPENCGDALWNYLQKYSMIADDPTPMLQPPQESEVTEKKKVKRKKTKQTDEEKSSPKTESKSQVKKPQKKQADSKKNQPGINSFLKKLKSP